MDLASALVLSDCTDLFACLCLVLLAFVTCTVAVKDRH